MHPARIMLILFICMASARAQPVSYSRQIRPILAENCFQCHGQDPNHRKAKLRLDTEEGQRAKKAIVPGRPDASELVKRIFTDDPDDHMPPADSNKKLTVAQKELIKRWIAEGAKFEGHWAFVTPIRADVPARMEKNPIDAFIADKLAWEKLTFSREAPRQTLIRRATIDLTGLPPTPEEIDHFLADKSADAYEKLIERLLASPHYGERMALPWLDAARYADSNGFQQDGDTFQWIWRDWVIKAFNANMPFDQFVIEQLAGDLLPNSTLDQKIATAFNRNHLLNGEGGAIPEEQRHVILFDRVDVTATNFLGLTMACAQCHDHKFDPITMKDYYSLMAGFANIPENGVVPGSSSRFRIADPFIEIASPEQKAKLAELEAKAKELRGKLAAKQKEWEDQAAKDDKFPDKEILALLRDPKRPGGDPAKKIKKYFDEKVALALPDKLNDQVKAADRAVADYKNEIPRVMVMQESRPRETFILDRGNYETKREKVTFSTPAFLPSPPSDAPKNRLGLAQWLVSPRQPLMARVIVNRLWQQFFGIGLVKTAEDFGVQSEVPVHPELLDWLAVEFRESGWDIKHLVRLIATSRAYRQSSKLTPELLARDPENRLLARAPRFRMHAMFLRDTALSTSGLLDKRLFGKPVYPYQPEGIWETLAITKERDFTYPASTGQDLYRRSLYTFWRRTVGPANMFDASNRQACRVRPSLTNTPLHALTTLNDVTWAEAARVFAERTMKASPDFDVRVSGIFRRVVSRHPNDNELAIIRRMFDKQLAHYKANVEDAKKFISTGQAARDASLDPAEHAAWSAVCLATFNLDEALTRE